MKPIKRSKNVDLPEPLGPWIEITSPREKRPEKGKKIGLEQLRGL